MFINITETPVIDLFLTLKIILNNPIVEIKRIGVVYPDTRVAYKTKLKEEMKIDEFIDIINDGITKEFSSEA